MDPASEIIKIKILYLEDNPLDAEIVLRELKQGGFEVEYVLVETKEDFLAELEKLPDLILSDYSLPNFDGVQAVKLVRQLGLDIPFILISGEISEEAAVRFTQSGVDDYLLKDNLLRLSGAVRGALSHKLLRTEVTAAGVKSILADQKLQNATQRQAAILNALPAQIALLDSEGNFQEVNESWRKFVWQNDQLIEKNIVFESYISFCERLIGKESKETAFAIEGIRSVLSGQSDNYAHEFSCSINGNTQWFRLVVSPLSIDENKGVVVMHLNVTDRVKAEEDKSLLAAAVEQSDETIVITDTTGKILYANPAFERSTGYSIADALGGNPRILKSGQHGSEFYREMWQTLTEGKVWSGHITNRRKDGELYNESVSITPIQDLHGNIVNYVGVKRDVTRELQLEAQLRQSQKMEAIGQLAGGIAHDFNNILAVIMMQSEVAQLEEQVPESVSEALGEIMAAAEKAANLTRQLLTFSRRQGAELKVMNLNEVIQNLSKMLQRVIREDVSLKLNLNESPLLIEADAGMLEQVLMNLSVNARHAMPNGGSLVVSTFIRNFKAGELENEMEFRPGNYIGLKVADSGCGMSKETINRIFEPFFTTKSIGEGTGHGLSTVFGIVKQHKGWIHVDSQLGKGSVFEIYFPPSSKTAQLTSDSVLRNTEKSKGSETILLVEDESSLRQVARAVLANGGYQALEAADGVEALQIWEQNSSRISLLVTDVTMPNGLDGIELATRLLEQNPSLKVIIMSGYNENLQRLKNFFKDSQVELLQKPFSGDRLLSVVRECFDSAKSV